MAVNTTIEVTLPAMGESVTEGTVLEWHKREGDAIAADEVLVEISTDKVDAEVPAPQPGRIVKIHAVEGATVEVGAVLAEIETTGGTPPTTAASPSDEGDPIPGTQLAREAEADALTLRARLDDVTDSGEGAVAELLRPYYLEYLREHGVDS